MAVDYDPQKAHEYYERNKQLKGRRSTKKFTQEQKEQWAYAKEQLAEEHADIKSDITESARDAKTELTERAKAAISQLRERLKAMPPEERKRWRDAISEMCGNIRQELRSAKQGVTGAAKAAREQEAVDYEARKDEAYNAIKGA